MYEPIADLIVDETRRALHDVGTSQWVTLHELRGITGNSVVHATLTALTGVRGQSEGVCKTYNFVFEMNIHIMAIKR